MSEEQPKLGPMISLQISLLGLIARTDPQQVGMIDLYQKLLGWTDEIAEQIEEVGGVMKAADEWDRAHPNPQGHCDNDDLRMCVTAYALKEALREV